jgi:lipoyl(octanoyl) transferase
VPGSGVPKGAYLLQLGQVPYQEAWDLQRSLAGAVSQGAIPDVVILLEHPPVITLGRRRTSVDNVIDAGAIPVFEIERGGDVTYHGPGQLVGYPILRLDESERDLHAYLRNLEEGLIGVLGAVGLAGARRPGFTGVWIGERKVASIGVAVRRWVTLHGFALNVATDLARFAAIRPCSLDAEVMTSLSVAAGRPIDVAAVKPLVLAHLGAALGRVFSLTDAVAGED